MQQACPSVRLFVCLSVCLSVVKIQKNAIFSNFVDISQLTAEI